MVNREKEGRWWREETLEEQLQGIRDREKEGRRQAVIISTPPQRDPATNYDLGTLALRQRGIRLHPHPKGPLCLHMAEGLPDDPAEAIRALQQAFEDTDTQLREFWAPLWTLEAKGRLRQHSRWLIRREQAIQTNARWVGELERCRMLLATTRENRDDAGTG